MHRVARAATAGQLLLLNAEELLEAPLELAEGDGLIAVVIKVVEQVPHVRLGAQAAFAEQHRLDL